MSVIPEPPAQTGEPVAPGAPGGADQLAAPSPSPAPADLQDLLWLRIWAALIDLAVLLGVFVVLSVATGGASWDQGASFTLGGGAGLLFLALVLGYYFGLEAAFGQTVGKYLLGVRVVRPDGARPPISAITVRTVLRIVDWLPLLYLVGFITMMVTGTRRQRLGDLAAHTGVGEAAPARHRGVVATLVAVVVLGVVAVGVQQAAVSEEGREGTGTYRAHGVSFDYPVSWREGSLTQAEVGADELWHTVVGPVTGSGGFDLVIVEAYRLNRPVTAADMGAVTPEVESLVRHNTEQGGGVVEAGPEQFTMGGLPALRFRIANTVDGTARGGMVVFAFDGTTEYRVFCQHTPEGLAEIQQGCDQILRTFTVNP
jgi:uncharacterized RDD family membrane protein YckC